MIKDTISHNEHFGVWAHAHNGQRIAAYARFSEHHRGFVVYDAQTGRRLTGDKSFKTLSELSRGCRDFTLNPMETADSATAKEIK